MPERDDALRMINNLLRYKDEYEGAIVVMKFGGALTEDKDVIANIAQQAEFLTHNLYARVVLVHGGGQQIDTRLQEQGIKVQKDEKTGLRITDAETLELSDQVLRGVNGKIVYIFNRVAPRVRAFGMAGYDGRAITAIQRDAARGNYTGHIADIDVTYINYLMNYSGGNVIPVIYPICHNVGNGEENRLNVNADEVAGMLAARLGAKRLLLCSDIPGVLDKSGNLIPEMPVESVESAIEEGVITGGMIPKVRIAAHAAEKLGTGGVVIVDGRIPGAILAEFIYEKGSGTLISNAVNLKKESPCPPPPKL